MAEQTRSNPYVRTSLLGFTIAALGLAAASPVLATPPFTTDLLIDGVVDFDEEFAIVEGLGLQSGFFSVLEGGVETTTFFIDDVTVGDDPLLGAFTDFGDGVVITGDGSAAPGEGPLGDFIEGLYAAGIDVFLAIENTSATDTYKVTFDVDFLHTVDADGFDAFAFSVFDVGGPSGSEVVSDIVSDTLFGDFKNGMDLLTFGDPIDDFGLSSFDVIVAPSSVEFVDAFWFFGGEALSDDAFSTGGFAGAITIGDVMRVPEPGVLFLFGAGLAAIGITRRKRTG